MLCYLFRPFKFIPANIMESIIRLQSFLSIIPTCSFLLYTAWTIKFTILQLQSDMYSTTDYYKVLLNYKNHSLSQSCYITHPESNILNVGYPSRREYNTIIIRLSSQRFLNQRKWVNIHTMPVHTLSNFQN